MTTKLKFAGGWSGTVTDEPLDLLPRLLGTFLIVSPYADRVEREKFLADTFGSQDLLWDLPDVFRFAPSDRQLVGAEFRIPEESASAEGSACLPVPPEVRPGGLRADEVKDFRHEVCTVLCRAPGDAVLTCLRDLDVLDEPLDARIGIAPDVALLVQHGTVVGWSLTDPARYLTTNFAARIPPRRPPAACSPNAWTWSPRCRWSTTWSTVNRPPWPASRPPTRPCASNARTGTGPTPCSS